MSTNQAHPLTGIELLETILTYKGNDFEGLIKICGYDNSEYSQNILLFYSQLKKEGWDVNKTGQYQSFDQFKYEIWRYARKILSPIDTFLLDINEYALKSAIEIHPIWYVILNDEAKAHDAVEFFYINKELYKGLFQRVCQTTFGRIAAWIIHETLLHFYVNLAARFGSDPQEFAEPIRNYLFEKVEIGYYKADESTLSFVEKSSLFDYQYFSAIIGTATTVLITDCLQKFSNFNYALNELYYRQAMDTGREIHDFRSSTESKFMIDTIMQTICSIVSWDESLFENTNKLDGEERVQFIIQRFDEIEQTFLQSA